MESLGIGNKNPFNLRSNHVQWLGKTGSYKGFVVFDTPEHGIRAGLINLATQVRRSSSLRNLVYSYAPPSENDSEAYYNYLRKKVDNDWHGVVYDRNIFLLLAYFITVYEGCPTSYTTIRTIDKQYHIFAKHLALLGSSDKT